jgi:hypothetical protein
MNVAMEETPASEPSFAAKIKAQFREPRTLFYIALALAAGAAGTAVGYKLYLKPIREIASIRYQSHLGLMRLYDLQMAYRKEHEAYANDLETLLSTTPDGAELREKLKATVDINTLAVIGDADRFRLEANIRDPQRTSVKIRGPLGER